MPALSTIGIGAAVVDYVPGAVVVWSLSWAQNTAGIAPVLDLTNQPPGFASVIFTMLPNGGATGVATLSATVDGVQSCFLTATVPEAVPL